MRKRILSVVFVIAMLLSLCVSASADDAASKVKTGTAVIIEIEDLKNDGTVDGAAYGTCFFVGNEGENPKYLVTAAHCVSDYMEYGEGNVIVVKNSYGGDVNLKMTLRVYFSSDDYVEAYVVDYDTTKDIAVLKLDKATEERTALTLRIPTEDMVGDTMYVAGYPGTADSVMDPASVWGVDDSLVTKGTIGRFVTTSGTGAKWIQSSDTNLDEGNSGGPIFIEDGTVIGLVSNCVGTATGAQTDFGVNIEGVVEMLNKNGIPFALASDAADEETEETEETVPFYKTTVFYVIIAVAVVAVIAVVVICTSKSKKKKKAAAAVEAAKKAAGDAPVKKQVNHVVISLAPQHAHKRVVINGEAVTLGRGKDNSIIFKEDTKGVSAHHCTVSWDAETGDYLLTDVGSTYGTFLMSGQKLQPKVVYHLKSGEQFYLGEKTNTVLVENE